MTGYVAVVGENVADAVVGDNHRGDGSAQLELIAGGGPANTAVALSRLGTRTKFVSRLAQGVLGELFMERLTRSGVDLSLSVTAEEPATLAITSVGEDGEAHYDFYATGTADWQWRRDELNRIDLREAACIHAGSLGLVIKPGGPLIERLLEAARNHSTISIDPNVRTMLVKADNYLERIGTWARLADILRLSEEDFYSIFPHSPFESIFNGWHEAGTSLIVLTRGADGVLASFNGMRFEVSTPSVHVVDTIGAGDAFTAGLLHWLSATNNAGGRIANLNPEAVFRALTFAAQVAALSCTEPGANPPWAESLPEDALGLLRT